MHTYRTPALVKNKAQKGKSMPLESRYAKARRNPEALACSYGGLGSKS